LQSFLLGSISVEFILLQFVSDCQVEYQKCLIAIQDDFLGLV